jgi:hypothetical protein
MWLTILYTYIEFKEEINIKYLKFSQKCIFYNI